MAFHHQSTSKGCSRQNLWTRRHGPRHHRAQASRKSDSQHITELETLYESGLTLSQLLPPKEIAQKLIELMSSKLNWHHIAIRLYHPEDETLELLAFNLPETRSTAEFQAS